MEQNDISVNSKVIEIIECAKNNAYKKVNEELIKMYWQIGEFLHDESKTADFGDAMSRSMSSMMVAEYKLQLPDKKILERKLLELIVMADEQLIEE